MQKDKKQLVLNTSWTTLSTIVSAIVQILRLSILARYLDKADFGIVAVLTLVLGLTYTFSDMGFSVAVMHKRDLSRKEFSSLYWFQLFTFSLLYFVIILFAKPISVIYDSPQIRTLLPIALIDIIFQGLGKLYDTLLLKQFKFKILAIRNIVSSLLSLIVAVVLAIEGYGVLSLVLSTLCHTFLLNIWNLIIGQKQMQLSFYISLRPVIPLIRIGLYQTGTQIIEYLSSKLDILIIGRVLGIESLGIYNLAKELVLKEVSLCNSIVNRVVLPYFSDLQSDHANLKRHYCKLLRIVSLPNFLFLLLLCVLSSQVVNILYGAKYLEVIPVLSILAIYAMACGIGNPVGNIIIAKGKTKLSFQYAIIRLFIYVPVTYISCLFGLIGLSWGQVLLAFFSIFLSWYFILFKTIGLYFREFLSAFFKQLIVTLFICLIGYYSSYNNILKIENNVIGLLIYGIPVFLLFVVAFYSDITEVVKSFVGGKKN